ncbi:MAG: ferritin-like domain-containing protein [Chloroflexota bacterium]|jgi:starvation-inducible DNA-binding protein|nr:ferritin-like domain-containing protein [Chloroflexota bacterium]MDH5242962.1 ferritin-like domain-containing protein [Chloroflexota bacterium]
MARLASVVDEEGAPDATEMIHRLITAHETVVATARAVVDVAEPTGDIATVDLATQRILVHQKTLWMLRSTVA